MSAYEVYARARGRLQTWRFVWRLRLRARMAGGRARVFVRRTNPFDLSFRRRRPLRRIERGLRLEIERGAEPLVYLGDRVTIGPDVTLRLGSAPLYLGDGVTVAAGSVLEAGGTVVLRERAHVGTGCAVVVRDAASEAEIHPYATLEANAAVLAGEGRRTIVGHRARLSAGSTALPGAHLRPGTVTPPAGSVVPSADARGRARAGTRPDVSVVVSTKDRVGMLPRLFEALEGQTIPPSRFELVIVDNGSSDDTLRWLRSRARRTPFATRVLRREPPGGPARGRNAGWREARGRVIAFTDDDCAPSPEWLATGVAAFTGDSLGIAQGRTDPEPREIAHLRGLAGSQRIEWESGLYETCNIFFRRDALEAAGGFSEDIPVPAAEDTELAWKVKGMGWDSAFVRDAVVYHAVHPGRLRGYGSRFRQWAEVHRTLRRTPEVRRAFFLGHFWTRWHAWFLLAAAGLLLGGGLVIGGVPWGWLGFALCLPYLGFLLRSSREALSVPERIAFAPVRAAADAIEVVTLARGSLRHRALLL